jgi:electron transfer flavoprotein beta subunit
VIKNGEYDLVIAGKESLDYNGGMVPGMISILVTISLILVLTLPLTELKQQFVKLMVVKETVSTSLPLIIGGQKG